MLVEILRINPDQTETGPFFYEGVIGQLGLSVPLPKQFDLPAGGSVAFSQVDVKSPFLYTETHFEGPIWTANIGANVLVGDGVSLGASSLVFQGNGEHPSINVSDGEPTQESGSTGLTFGAGVDIGAGFLFKQLDTDQEYGIDASATRDLLNYTLASEADFSGSFGFTLGSSILAPCGRQYLREFVAENRALFANPDSKVAILGFTDSTGSDATNLTLSQGRADAIKTAILEMLGPNLALPAANIYAQGFGEDPCRTDRQTPTSNPTDASEPTDPAWMDVVPDEFKHTVRTTKDLAPRISDTAPPNAAWRQVVIAVNGVFVTDMKSPTPTAP